MTKEHNNWHIATVVLLAILLLGMIVVIAKPMGTNYGKIEKIVDDKVAGFETYLADKLGEYKIVETIPNSTCKECVCKTNFYAEREKAWDYIIDNWDSEDFDDLFEEFNSQIYDLDEIGFTFKNDKVWLGGDFEKPDYYLKFKVIADYDQDGEEEYFIQVDYYKDYKPEVSLI